jgi:23S rRNA pseudouridine2457 synthase
MQYYYFYIYKPYGTLSQFTEEVAGQSTLGQLFKFPPDVYPLGRLDRDSEGLLILTNDRRLNSKLLHPKNQHERTYFVQVEGIPDLKALRQLEQGVQIRVSKKDYQTQPVKVELLDEDPILPDRRPPIRFRKQKPTSWLKMTLTEGKNRQVRKMCAAIGFPCLRLVRYSIEGLTINDMKVGAVKQIAGKELFQRLAID